MEKFNCGITLEHFKPDEFACPCCGHEKMHKDTLSKIEGLRVRYGKPIKIIEGGGYRCAAYSSSQHSAHRDGRAFDLGVPNTDYHKIISIATILGFAGIGVKNKGGQYQLHLDDAVNIPGIRPRPWVWTYDSNK